MRPPKGFEDEKFPLRHRLSYSYGLTLGSDTNNTAFMPIVMHSTDIDNLPSTIQTNPHNSLFESDTGPLCHAMSIIDRMSISLKFNMSHTCGPAHHSSGTSTNEIFEGQDIPSFKFLWRPVFNVYPEKMDAADDDTTTTVAAILGMTKDATNEDIVALTTNKLPTGAPSELNHPVSSAYAVQVFQDFNYTTNVAMEDHVFDEDLLQDALRRYTNKGALRSCLGRTRHVTLTRAKPYANFFIDKFVPRAIRRVQPYGMFGIQVHLPIMTDPGQMFISKAVSSTYVHLGVKMIANYHEWNFEHEQGRGTPA